MYLTHKFPRSIQFLRIALLLPCAAVALTLGVTPSLALPSPWSCADAIPIEVGKPIDWIAGYQELPALLALTIESEGQLALEAQNVDGNTTGTWLEVITGRCGMVDESRQRVESFLDRGLFDLWQPGTVLVRVGRTVDDPTASSLRLSTQLLANEPQWTPEKDGDPGDDTGEEDREILPFVYPGDECVPDVRSTRRRAGSSFDKDGDPGDDTGEEDREILPLVGGMDPCRLACAGSEPANDLLHCAQSMDVGDHVEDRLVMVFAAREK